MLKRIFKLLQMQPGLKARGIASGLGVERKKVNQVLSRHTDIFVQDQTTYCWSLLDDTNFVLEFDVDSKWIAHRHFEVVLSEHGSPLDTHHEQVTIKITDERHLLICAAARVLALSNQLAAAGKKVVIDFTNNDATVSYLSRACFFARLDPTIEVLPNRPAASDAELLIANNPSLVELLEICPDEEDTNVPERIKNSFVAAFGDKDATKLFTLVAEMVGNVEEHSETEIPGFAGLQAYVRRNQKQSVIVVISDSGKGICATLRPGLDQHYPQIAKQFPISEQDSNPKIILHAMQNGGLSRLGKGRGAGFHASGGEAAKLDAKVTIRQENFAVYMRYQNGALEPPDWKNHLPKLLGTHIVFEFSLTDR